MTWEYLAYQRCNQDELTKLGADGWELVSAVYDSNRMVTVLYFKRPGGAR